MTVYYMGSQTLDYNNTASINVLNTVNDSYYMEFYNDVGSPNMGTLDCPISLGGLTDVWAGFTTGNIIGSASESNVVTLFQLQTSGAQGIVRIQQTASLVRQFQYWNGSAWVSLGTLTGFTTRNGRRIDIRCKIHSSAGEFSVYVDRVLQFTLTGNTNFFAATIDSFRFIGWGNFNGRVVTEVCVADEDTRKIRIKNKLPTGNSATNTGWSGGFGDLDNNNVAYATTDADSVTSSAGGQNTSYTHAALGLAADDGAILAVAVSVRAKNDGSSADFDMLVRTGGTNYTKSHGRTINTTNTNGYYAIWSLNPGTTAAWTEAQVDACELGMQSKNAGVSTVYAMSILVAIRDDFFQPWEAGYPNASTDGIAMVEVTAPASTGYMDITVPDMVADGCSPSFALILTNGGTSNAANASARLQAGFVANDRRAEFSAKGMVGFLSNDASAASGTSRQTQSRTLNDMAQANGGWLVDLSGLVVRWEKFIKGGMRVHFNTTTSGRKFTVVFFWGAELKVQYWTQNLGTVTTAQAVTGIGFKPDAALFFSAGNTIASTSTGYFSFGVASDDGGGLEQRCLMRFSPNAVAAGPVPTQLIDNTAIGGLLTNTGPAVSWDLTLNSFDADGFTVQASASAVSATLYSILLHHTGGKKFNIIDISTPTVTGAAAHNGAGFSPAAAFGALASVQALNSLQSDVEQASSCSLFVADQNLDMVTVAIVEDSVLDPSDTNSYQDTANLMRLGTNGSTTVSEVVGTLSAFGTDGLNVNYTVASATQKKGFALVMEAMAGGPPVGIGQSLGLLFVTM